jgi:hypothetical protein
MGAAARRGAASGDVAHRRGRRSGLFPGAADAREPARATPSFAIGSESTPPPLRYANGGGENVHDDIGEIRPDRRTDDGQPWKQWNAPSWSARRRDDHAARLPRRKLPSPKTDRLLVLLAEHPTWGCSSWTRPSRARSRSSRRPSARCAPVIVAERYVSDACAAAPQLIMEVNRSGACGECTVQAPWHGTARPGLATAATASYSTMTA